MKGGFEMEEKANAEIKFRVTGIDEFSERIQEVAETFERLGELVKGIGDVEIRVESDPRT